jgi:hypothetical protein
MREGGAALSGLYWSSKLARLALNRGGVGTATHELANAKVFDASLSFFFFLYWGKWLTLCTFCSRSGRQGPNTITRDDGISLIPAKNARHI